MKNTGILTDAPVDGKYQWGEKYGINNRNTNVFTRETLTNKGQVWKKTGTFEHRGTDVKIIIISINNNN